ncbi:MAG: SDR family NAD(P)-dependent oxidoreductase [Verrucomicrobiota bacterium]
MRNVLVTGGAGFIGSHTVERLLDEGADSVVILDDFNDFYDVRIKEGNLPTDDSRVKVVRGDMRQQADVERAFAAAKIDTVIHLGARAGVRPSRLDPELYIDTNIKGTFYLLEAARKAEVDRFVFASSSSVYGLNKKLPFSEEDRIEQTISPYAATKLAGEQLCSNYANLYGMRIVCLRFFTVYGPRQRPDLAISKFTRLILNDEPIERYGDGSTSRDYTYVEDIVDGIFGSLRYDGPLFDIFNLGGSQTVTLSELIELVEKAVGKKAQIIDKGEQPGDLPRTYADISKANRLLGFDPRTPIFEGVPKYVAWYREHVLGEKPALT